MSDEQITEAIRAALTGDEAKPMTVAALRDRVIEALGKKVPHVEVLQPLQRLVDSGSVLEIQGRDVRWRGYPHHEMHDEYYIGAESYTAEQAEIQRQIEAAKRKVREEDAANMADEDLHKRHPDEWNELYQKALKELEEQ